MANPTVSKYAELQVLNKTITDRQQYHRQQELIIADMIERGNTVLMGLTHDIALAENELRTLKVDVRLALQDKLMLRQDLEELRQELGSLSTDVVFTSS
jgi:hypothetical protein